MSEDRYMTKDELFEQLTADIGRPLTRIEEILANRFHVTLTAMAHLIDDLERCSYGNSRAVMEATIRAEHEALGDGDAS